MNISKIGEAFQPTRDKKCSVSKRGMVATAFPNATKAGVEMLKKGGNAVDVACAAALALGVCEPQASGLGGQTLALIHINGKTIAIDGSSRAPSLSHLSRYEKKTRRVIGYKATTVPSTPAVLGYLNEHYGRLDWATIVKPSIRIARRGYRITRLQHKLQQENLKKFFRVKSRSGAKYFLKDGMEPYEVGDLFVQEDLAELLKHLSSHSYRSFYHGTIAKMIDEDMKKNKGYLRADDLSLIPEPVERKPIRRRYRGIPIFSMPPPAAGNTLLLVLMMLNNMPKKFLRSRTSESYHYVAETFRKAYLHRTQRPYDPKTYHQIKERIHLSRSFARTLSESIRNTIDPSLPLTDPLGTEDTTHLSVMDNEGNAVSLTQSIELVYGSKAAAEDLGFLYNNYMSAFEFENPNHPFYLRPNAIPWTSVAPTMVFYRHKPWIVVGSPGSARIYSVISHFLSRVIDGDNSMDKAMMKARIHCSLGGKMSLEKDMANKKLISYLKHLGYKVDKKKRFSFFMGAIHAVLKRQSGKGFQGIAEVRRDGTAEGI